MTRRLLWLLLGAAAGIAGYRRLMTLARSVSPAAAGRGLTRFAADVREGMELYMRRQAGRTASTLDSQPAGRPVSGPAARRALTGMDHMKDGS